MEGPAQPLKFALVMWGGLELNVKQVQVLYQKSTVY